jgi:serine protease
MVACATSLAASAVPARAACVNNPNNLVYFGGPVLTTPKIYLVLWGFGTPANDPSGEIPFVTNALSASPGWHWMGQATQYSNSAGTFITNQNTQFGQVIVDNTRALPVDAPPPSMTCPTCTGPTLSAWRTAVANEALAVSASVDRSANAMYVVFTPPRTNQPEQANGAGGWHGSVAIPGAGRFLPFADVPYQTNSFFSYGPANVLNNTTSVVLHEVMEAITDPFYDQGQAAWSTNCGSENADFCGTYTNQKILGDFVTPNTIALPLTQGKSANGGNGACIASYTKEAFRFYVNTYQNNPGYLYTSLGGQGCGLSGIWWDGVALVGNVASASWGPKRIDLVAMDVNSHIQHLWTNDNGGTMFGGDDLGAPSGWQPFGTPAIASWGPYHLDIFTLARTLSGSTALFHKLWNQNADNSITSTGWENWGSPTGDTLYYANGVAAVSDSPGRIDTFMIATNSNGAVSNLWQAWRFGSTASPTWTNLGNPGAGISLTGAPSVASWGPGRFDVFVGDGASNRRLRHWFWQSGCCTGWDDWGTLPSGGGMNLLGDPSVIAMGDNRLDITVQGSDKNFYKRTWDWGDRGWSGSLGCSNPGARSFSMRGTR